MDKIKKTTYGPEWRFAVQSPDEGEVVSMAAKPAKEMHGKTVSDRKSRKR